MRATELMERGSDEVGSSKPDTIPAVSHVDMAPETPPIMPGGRRGGRGRGPKSLYLLYNHLPYPTSSWSNSFYKIAIPDPKDSDSGSGEITREVKVEGDSLLSPMLEMKANNKLFTKDMRCARLGSKVYFLGGQLANNFNIPATDPESELDLEKAKSLLFSRDVYVIDLARGEKEIEIQRLDARLNCGKPVPCVFAAEGELYALGSATLISDFPGLSASMGGKMFECYDPGVGEWKVLDDPPAEGPQWVAGFAVILERHGLVLFEGLGWNGRLLYDLRRGKWVPISPDFFSVSVAAVQPCSYGYALYGIDGFGSPMKLKQLLQVQEDEKEDGIQSTLSLIGGGSKYDYLYVDILNCDKEHILLGDPYIDSAIQLHSLGDGYFCHVIVGDLPHPNGRDPFGYLPSDPCSRAVKITIFKEIIHDHIIHSPSTAAAECESSFQVKVLYSQEYVIRTPSYSKGSLVSSFVLSQVHSKKSNRLDQKRLNDLVYVKYNLALKRNYDARDQIDPICLREVDASNEWLMGRMEGKSDDEENELVFDNDDLTWVMFRLYFK